MREKVSRSEHRLHELFMELMRVVSTWHVDPTDPEGGLSVSQAFAVHALDTDPPLSQQQLAARLRLEKSSVSRLVADLERRGLLTRERDDDNRRLYRLRLTDDGRAAHARLGTAFHHHYQRIGEALTAAERDALVVGLSAFLRAVRATAHPDRHG